jgi:aspartate/methionine/tyrosine aminotransferase
VPRHPQVSPAAGALPATPYSVPLPPDELGRESFPLHLGDTWRLPPVGCRLEDLAAVDHPGLYRYAPTQGMPELLDALVERTRASASAPVRRKNVLVTAGATAGFAAVLGAILAPGDEVLLLAPHWPLAAGLTRAFGGVPVEVPFHGSVPSGASAEEAVALAAAQLTERTVAIYLNSPNNPSGAVTPRAWVEALVEWARREGLWVLADDVFADFVYEGEAVEAFALASERTFSFRSFSKTYGMAGNRCGWVVGPLPAMTDAARLATQLVYSAPTGAQIAALNALQGAGEAWLAEARIQYRETGARVAARLGVPPPQGGAFLFLEIGERLGAEDLPGFLRRCASRGLLLAPGASFGPYPTCVRLCFTAAPPVIVERGAELLADLLGI